MINRLPLRTFVSYKWISTRTHPAKARIYTTTLLVALWPICCSNFKAFFLVLKVNHLIRHNIFINLVSFYVILFIRLGLGLWFCFHASRCRRLRTGTVLVQSTVLHSSSQKQIRGTDGFSCRTSPLFSLYCATLFLGNRCDTPAWMIVVKTTINISIIIREPLLDLKQCRWLVKQAIKW